MVNTSLNLDSSFSFYGGFLFFQRFGCSIIFTLYIAASFTKGKRKRIAKQTWCTYFEWANRSLYIYCVHKYLFLVAASITKRKRKKESEHIQQFMKQQLFEIYGHIQLFCMNKHFWTRYTSLKLTPIREHVRIRVQVYKI